MITDLPVPEYGRHLIENLTEEDLGRYIVFTQDVPRQLYGKRFPQKSLHTIEVKQVDLDTLDQLWDTCRDCDTVVAFGGGLALDAAKYVAWKGRKKYLAVPTVISADVALCRAVAVREDWKVRYIGDKMPDRLLIDFDLIQSAPAHLNRGGVCDILSCYTALEDWKIAHYQTGEPLDLDTVKKTEELLTRLFSHQKEIHNVTEAGLRFLIDGYLEEVRLCEEYGSSRPEEGSEHFFAYNLEHRMRQPFLHGTIVSLGVVLMTMLQERDPREVIDFLDGAGVLWKPEQAGLREEDVIGTIETLYDYCTNEKFYYTVVNERKPDTKTIRRLLDELKTL